MIDLNDLRHSISTALNLGRYTIVVKQVGGEPVPASITLDLVERDDDGFSLARLNEQLAEGERDIIRQFGAGPTISPEGDALNPWGLDEAEQKFATDVVKRSESVIETLTVRLDLDISEFEAKLAEMKAKHPEAFGSDDHGPAVPVQEFGWRQGEQPTHPISPSPRVYEFALQDVPRWSLYERDYALANADWQDAPDYDAAAAADWVHVYDRVTRERRTLKSPEPDAVLTGLRDVAADLRGKGDAEALGEAITEVASGAVERRAAPGKWRVYREGGKVVYETFDQPKIIRGAVYAPFANSERGEEAFTPAADPMPPVGPLTSTEGLKAGDVLRVVFAAKHGGMLGFEDGALATFTQPNSPKGLGAMMSDGEEHWWDIDRFAFVCRPGVWMPWEGGENPVPGLTCRARSRTGYEGGEPSASEEWLWNGQASVTAYMIVDTPPAS